jgi:hypothetical protein
MSWLSLIPCMTAMSFIRTGFFAAANNEKIKKVNIIINMHLE